MIDGPLSVWLHAKPIGTLIPTKNGARFQFDDESIETRLGLPYLSTALLVQNEPFDTTRTKNWFSGLLPEDARLNEIKRFFGIESDDYLAILEQVGWECAGAVAIRATESSAPTSESASDSWSSARAKQTSRDAPDRPGS
jgi:serine/threonine-protein kinase HipA